MVIVEDVNALLTQGSALVISIITLVGLAIKFAASRSHSPRLAKAETEIQNIKDDIAEINANKDKILAGVGVAGALVPQLDQAAKDHDKQIKQLQADLAAAQAKINQLSTLVPKS